MNRSEAIDNISKFYDMGIVSNQKLCVAILDAVIGMPIGSFAYWLKVVETATKQLNVVLTSDCLLESLQLIQYITGGHLKIAKLRFCDPEGNKVPEEWLQDATKYSKTFIWIKRI